MRNRRLGHRWLAAILSLGLAACASGGGAAGEDPGGEPEAAGDEVTVEIHNDVVPGSTIVVWIVPETGNRQRLGSIPPNGRNTFRYRPVTPSLDHRLVAEVDGASDERSNPFTLVGVSRVRWEVSDRNVITND